MLFGLGEELLKGAVCFTLFCSVRQLVWIRNIRAASTNTHIHKERNFPEIQWDKVEQKTKTSESECKGRGKEAENWDSEL